SPGTRQTLYAVIGSGPTTGIGAFAGSVKNSTNNVLTVGQPFCAAGVFNGSNSNVYLGTSQPGTSQAAVVGLSAFAAGANSLVQAELFGFAGINFTSGSIAEVIIYQGAHTPQQVSWVFQYLSSGDRCCSSQPSSGVACCGSGQTRASTSMPAAWSRRGATCRATATASARRRPASGRCGSPPTPTSGSPASPCWQPTRSVSRTLRRSSRRRTGRSS